MNITLFKADCCGNPGNCSYPRRYEISDADTLREAVSCDYVAAEYINNYRSRDNFLGSNCIAMDCDNDQSDNPEDWVTPESVADSFPNVEFAVHFSRSHMREKNGKAPRPKFHVLFPIDLVTDAEFYVEMKQRVLKLFPFFDSNALDAARFFFGTQEREVKIFEGGMNLTEFLAGADFDDKFSGCVPRRPVEVIKEGSRNSTLSRFAARMLVKYGSDSDEAYNAFLEKSRQCSPPLGGDELGSIWRSALNFYSRIKTQPGYISPERYNDNNSYRPTDYTDVAQAELLARNFSNELRYSPSTHFIRYIDNYWQETELGAQALTQELTRRQLNEANRKVLDALKRIKDTGADSAMKGLLSDEQQKALEDYADAISYHKFVIKRRDSKYITAALKEVRPMVEIDQRELDTNEFYLCTPKATYDLRLGMEGARPHNPEDYITKMTALSPSDRGMSIWLDFLNTIFCGDQELIDYVQEICGLAATGKVFVEAMIIAYGSGRNGKSTFWNTIARVLGTYSGNISADTLTIGCRRNVKPEMAEIKGKRILIAAELPEGTRLNDSVVKQLCSTDEVFAEKKYKTPFAFRPCHTLILYTNHLPRVGASDDGTWRRLIVIPFSAKIEGNADIKNYADYLYTNAGEAVLAWIIEGAKKVWQHEYKIPAPDCVRAAISAYREQNDWFRHFLEDRCETGGTFKESSSALYTAYRKYCDETNEYTRSTADFYNALHNSGFERIVRDGRKFYVGIKLKDDTYGGDYFV